MVRRHNFTQVQAVFQLVDAFAKKRDLQGAYPPPIGQVKFVIPTRKDDWELKEVIELITIQNASGLHLFFGSVRLPDGSRRQHYLKDKHKIYVTSQYYQTAVIAGTDGLGVDLTVKEPDDPYLPEPVIETPTTIVLQPAATYPFPNVPMQASDMLLRGHVAKRFQFSKVMGQACRRHFRALPVSP